MFQYTSKLEVNLLRGKNMAVDFNGLSTFIVKSRIPTLVVDPEVLSLALLDRSKISGQYKIITTVDFDTGKKYALDKLYSLPQAIFECDGLEVLLTADRSDKECLNEMKSINDYIHRLNPLMEIRWVLGLRYRSIDSISNFLRYLPNVPGTFVRTDHHVEIPAISVHEHQENIDLLKKHTGSPIKISGNITIETMKLIKGATRFDVSPMQAKKIAQDAKNEDNKQYDKTIKQSPSVFKIGEEE